MPPALPAPPITKRRPGRILLRFGGALGVLFLCTWGVWTSARTGLARLVADYGVRTNQLPAATLATQLTPGDPEAHYARASVFTATGALAEARAAYEAAIRLRPADYVLWLELGKLREQDGDMEGALAAIEAAVRLAPYYAEPRWQLGNSYLRAGRQAEALTELRRAATRDPTHYPNLLALAWSVAGHDPQLLVTAVRPDTPATHLLVAHFLTQQGAAQLAVEQFRAAGAATTEIDRRALIKELLAARSYDAAYQLWTEGQPGAHAPEQITDGGFEQPVRLDDVGFGWQFARDMGDLVKFSLDAVGPQAGTHSLRLEFAGNSAPATELLAQLVRVEPGARYRLHCAARTEALVTGGPLVVRAVGLAAAGDAVLAESAPLANSSTPWRDVGMEFTVPSATRVVRLVVTRQACAGGGACPIFGQAWLDEFTLAKL